MADTYKHQVKYKLKHKWRSWLQSRYPEFEENSFYEHCVSMGETRRKEWMEKESWRSHRHKWKNELKKEDWNAIEKLPVKPLDVSYDIW